jgi:MFS family permease
MHSSVSDSHDYNPLEVRRNFRFLFTDCIFFIFGMAFIDPSTVIPAFLSTITDSSLVIGLVMAIRPASQLIPQMWAAHYLSGRTQHKSYLMKVASASRIATVLFSLTLFLSGPENKGLMLGAFIVMFATFWLSEGFLGVSWTDLVAKTIPERLRGRLWGSTQAAGGLGAALAGLLVAKILSSHGLSYPKNFALLALTGGILFSASFASLFFVREPHGPAEKQNGSFLEYARDIRRMVRTDAELRRFLLVQVLSAFYNLPFAFYILYAKKVSGLGGGVVGLLLSAQIIGGVVWGAIAGYISDRRSPKAAIILTLLAGITAPVLALIVKNLPLPVWMLIFFFLGAVSGSIYIGSTNYLLEMCNPTERRTYVGIMNTANAPTLIFPVLGGIIVQKVSFAAAFAITAVALTIALFLASTLKSRHRTR